MEHTENELNVTWSRGLYSYDTTLRIAINADVMSGLMDNLGIIDTVSALYVWVSAGRYGLPRPVLRKRLKMDRDEFTRFVDKFLSRGIFRERATDADGNPIPLYKRRIARGHFPAVIQIEKEGNFSLREYKLDIDYFIRCFNTWSDNKTMLTYLGYAFKLFPYLNQKYGFLCENPRQEWLGHIVPLKKKRFAEIIGVSQRTISRFIDACPKQWETSSSPVCLGGDGKLKSGKTVFMLNPLLFYHKDTDPMIFFWKWGEGSDDLTIVDFNHESPIQRR